MMLKTPPLGWNSWDCYGAAVDEATVRRNADYMAKYLKPYGWEYVVVDIQWSEPTAASHDYHDFAELCMDEYSRLIPAENRFPSSKGGKGFAPLADYVHSLGLKFGIHIMRGIPRQAAARNTKILGSEHTAREIARANSVCFWNSDMYGVNTDRPGAREYYESLLALYKSWGVDYIKCDDICTELPRAEKELRLLSECVQNCGREIVLSLSPGPAFIDRAEFYKEVAQLWRITGDFWDNWEQLYKMFERCSIWSPHVGYGHFPDADMLPIGAIRQVDDPDYRSKFTKDELETMMALWCIFRSPLMIGAEMTKLTPWELSLLQNEDLLEMSRLSRHPHPVFRRAINGVETVLWIAAREGGGSYLAVFNLGDEENEITLSPEALDLPADAAWKDLFGKETFTAENGLKLTLPSHGTKAFCVR